MLHKFSPLLSQKQQLKPFYSRQLSLCSGSTTSILWICCAIAHLEKGDSDRLQGIGEEDMETQ
ncbi:hypothetical protein QUB80_00135 [Chlorogloeopsis sp. ULAP01]|uniref:hypothetical protein n=1 Tax=Chlorogloeopsis sp. ULAP01 TaxID=3056483 RepID=UPI0025AAE48F|nr:hypothetical protein [Chlorogloeopsis sp. ULAP01]MDM9379116.1 hypothetical protein [Chlorogloeopsis sp. ULAP01]